MLIYRRKDLNHHIEDIPVLPHLLEEVTKNNLQVERERLRIEDLENLIDIYLIPHTYCTVASNGILSLKFQDETQVEGGKRVKPLTITIDRRILQQELFNHIWDAAQSIIFS